MNAPRQIPVRKPLRVPDSPLPPGDGHSVWWVCHTRPRCEKKFSALCDGEAWVNFLPVRRVDRRYGARIREYHLPLFNGYVFARLPAELKPRAYGRDYLVRMIPVKQEGLFLEQVEQIRRIIASGVDISVTAKLEKGVRVRVKRGPLMGMIGMVEDPERPKGIVVSMDVLQQGVRVQIDAEVLEQIA